MAQRLIRNDTNKEEKPYCACSASHKTGFSFDVPSGIWVCAGCRKPSKALFERAVMNGNKS